MPRGGYGRPSAFDSYLLGRPMAISGGYNGSAYAIASSGGRVAVADTFGGDARSNVYRYWN